MDQMLPSDLPDFSTLQIIVFGDLMLDRYWYGDVDRISPEAPVPVVKVKNVELRPGGAANVALNISSLGAKVILFGFIGSDSEGEQLRELLESKGVTCCFSVIANHPTITKLRLIGHSQQLIRMDFEEGFHTVSCDDLLRQYQYHLKTSDAVILSDYAKGSLAKVAPLIHYAKAADKPIFLDPKGVDMSRYHHATLLTPNRREFELIVGVCHDYDEMVTRARALIATQQFEALLITLGSEGMLLVEQDKDPYFLPTHARQVYDVTGAGDTVIAVLALTFAATGNMKQAVLLSNTAAGIVVGKLGSATVSVAELRHALKKEVFSDGIVTQIDLKHYVDDAHARGEKVVMTNGCFDILHSGHIHYLNQAKSLGDRLIVAVNTDDSVKVLKGPTRPFNSLHERMSILSGLRAVDWVVPFSEKTPARLISEILPDILVKGGDYQVEDVAGSEAVLAHGGEVRILDFVEGKSTTSLVARIKQI